MILAWRPIGVGFFMLRATWQIESYTAPGYVVSRWCERCLTIDHSFDRRHEKQGLLL